MSWTRWPAAEEKKMGFLGQTGTVTRLGLSTLRNRFGASLVVVIGMACVVGALLSILSLSTGVMNVVGHGHKDRAIVMSQGAQFEGASTIKRADLGTISDAPGVMKAADGRPAVSAEIFSNLSVYKKSDGLFTFVAVRGVGTEAQAVRPELHIVKGRMFQPGKFEVIVGKNIPTLYKDMDIGSKLDLPQGQWTVVGIFESGGDILEGGTVLTDADTLSSALRAPAYKSVWVRLKSPADFATLRKALTANPSLSVELTSETDYLKREGANINTILTVIAFVVGGIMGLGAMFGALNTMYSAVSSRKVEIATLRAIGFGGGAVIFSVLAESLFLALVGALIGAFFAWAAFAGHLQSFGGVAIKLGITPRQGMGGVFFAFVLAFIGGIFPALKAARQPIATAIRAT
jgi:putative ABC transport system permease protein